VGVLSGRTEHGEQASGQFVQAATELGLIIPISKSFFHEENPYEQDFRQMLADVRARSFDALMLADELPWAGKLLVDMGKMGVTEPILATNKLDSGDLWDEAGKAANNVYVASAVDPESKLAAYVAFRDRFHRRFNADPDYGAAQGYEAFMLFASACQQSSSAAPVVVATTLKTNSWHGIFGEVSFEDSGDVAGRAVVVKHMQDGVFHTVAAEKDVE
jgi:branched-chain amino acid transport system substrate-binding protein